MFLLNSVRIADRVGQGSLLRIRVRELPEPHSSPQRIIPVTNKGGGRSWIVDQIPALSASSVVTKNSTFHDFRPPDIGGADLLQRR